MKPFQPTALMPRRILAERVGEGVACWYEGEDMKSFYPPDALGYDKWAALADEQAQERETA